MKYVLLLLLASQIAMADDFFDSEGNPLKIMGKGAQISADLVPLFKYDGDEFATRLTAYARKVNSPTRSEEETSLSGWKVFMIEGCKGHDTISSQPVHIEGKLSHKIVVRDEVRIACYYNDLHHYSEALEGKPVFHGHYVVWDLVSKKKKREGWMENGRACGDEYLYNKAGQLKQTIHITNGCQFY